jgi:hypothetical protein
LAWTFDNLESAAINIRKIETKELPNKFKNLTRTAAKPKDFERKVPKYLVVNVEINNQVVRALIDSGSLADFVSTTVAD